MTMEILRHRHAVIEVGSDGIFYADVPESGKVQSDTLAGVKKQIDRAKSKFRQEPQPGLMLGHGFYEDNGKLRQVTVTSVSRDRFDREECWVVEGKSKNRSKHSAEIVYLDNPKNRKLVDRWVKAYTRKEVARKQMEELEKQLEHFKAPPPKKKLQPKGRTKGAKAKAKTRA
jgi:hypothetical protein